MRKIKLIFSLLLMALFQVPSIKSKGNATAGTGNDTIPAAQLRARAALAVAVASRQQELDAVQTGLTAVQAALDKRNTELQKAAIRSGTVTEQIITDLLKEKIITGREKLSFQLDSQGLIVNGHKQSPALHQQFVNKYLKAEPGIKLSYNSNQ